MQHTPESTGRRLVVVAGVGAATGTTVRPFGSTAAAAAVETVTTLCAGVSVVAGASAGSHETQTDGATVDPSGSTDGTPPRGGVSPGSSTSAEPTTDASGRADDTNRRVAEQTRAFYFLDNLLRHHVLDGPDVVDGYAERLATGEGDPERATTVIRDRVATTVTFTSPEAVEVWSAAGGDAVVWEPVENGIVHDANARVHLSVVGTDDAVWLQVADDGPGIDTAAAELFSPGPTGDQGLGLSLVATLVWYGRGEVQVSPPAATTGPPGVAPDDEIPAVVDAGGVCVSLRFHHIDRPQPSTPAADRTVEHAFDRPQPGDGGGDDG